MGAALVSGLIRTGWEPSTVTVAEADPTRRAELAEVLAGVPIGSDPVDADGVVLAVKPGDAETACRAVAATNTPRVLSIMAGVPLERLELWVGPASGVVRGMPNTPAQVGAGVSAVCGGSRADEADVVWAEEILGSVGAVVRVPEPSLDAVTGLSGSGPAYVFLVAEALIDAGVHAGLSRPVSRTLALHTLAGAGRLLLESGSEPEELRAQVTSPGGTTAAGLRVLESRAVRSAFLEAVVAATDRSRQLGD
jgi:pyrroline-5-carboxylate reductase